MEFEDFVRARGPALLRHGYVLTGNPEAYVRSTSASCWCRATTRTCRTRRSPTSSASPEGLSAARRFLVGTDVYDPATDTPARLDGPTGWSGTGTSSEPSTILYWDAAEKGAFRVLNLAAVPPAQ